MHDVVEEGGERGTEVLPFQRQLDGGLEVVELVADVVPARLEAPAVDLLAVEQDADGVGELELATLARRHLLEGVEDLGREDIPAHDRQVGRGLLGRRLLHDLLHPHHRAVDVVGLGAAVEADLRGLDRLEGDDAAPEPLVGQQHLFEYPRALVHDVVAEQHGEGFVAHVLAGGRHGMSQPLGLALADVVDVRHLGDLLHLLQLVDLVAGLQVVLQLEGAVEMVLDRALAAAGDDQDVADACPHCLFHHLLDGGLVHQREHLLGLCLRRREEARTQAGGRDDRLANVCHCSLLLPRSVDSSPRNSREMFWACRATTRAATPATTAVSACGPRHNSTATGKPMATTSDPTDARPTALTVTAHTTAAASTRIGSMTMLNPAAVATPLPPRNRRVTGKQWPTTLAAPPARAGSRPERARAMPVTSAPLARSPPNTTAPAFRPAMRYTLVAPGLPDPSWATS